MKKQEHQTVHNCSVLASQKKKNNVAHDLPAAPYPPLPKAWSDNKISISTFSKSQWMGSLKRLKAPRHTLHKLSDRWSRLTSLLDLQHLHVNERSITWDSPWTEKEQITFASDGSNQANGQKMVANGARYVWWSLQLSSSLSINPERTHNIATRGGGGRFCWRQEVVHATLRSCRTKPDACAAAMQRSFRTSVIADALRRNSDSGILIWHRY